MPVSYGRFITLVMINDFSQTPCHKDAAEASLMIWFWSAGRMTKTWCGERRSSSREKRRWSSCRRSTSESTGALSLPFC
jgi:hypothetical protein